MADVERTYPPGVPCWIDLEQPDVDAAQEFYGRLLGWEFEDRLPPGSPYRYVIATLDGAVVGALCGPGDGVVSEGLTGASGWQTYVATADAEAAAQAVPQLGGRVLQPPTTVGPAGTSAVCADPSGVVVRLWQPGQRTGVQLVNAPGAWNFSHLRTDEPSVVAAFYAPLLGWRVVDQGWATTIQVPGYGEHLAATVDPGIRERQAGAPEGFADVVAAVLPLRELEIDHEDRHWDVVLSVADRDDAAARAEDLGATVLHIEEDGWTRTAVVRDPQGAALTLSQLTPPDDW